jgi:nucleotide-binding universal stress UspA family protein
MVNPTSRPQGTGPDAEQALFRRVVCGVDSSPESREAVRQVHAFQGDRGVLTVISVLDTALAAQAGWTGTSATASLKDDAELALGAAELEAPGAATRLLEGRPDQVLVAEARKARATLVAVGTHGISRPIGIALGSVATIVLHEAPCSVLVARPRPDENALPSSIVAGIDGSDESAAAWAVARTLADRLQIEAVPVTARPSKDIDLAAVHAVTEDAVLEEGDPVDTLLSAATNADLLVLGSRGLHGVRALGSVSERVAHKAPCSVLVVRPPTDA